MLKIFFACASGFSLSAIGCEQNENSPTASLVVGLFDLVSMTMNNYRVAVVVGLTRRRTSVSKTPKACSWRCRAIDSALSNRLPV